MDEIHVEWSEYMLYRAALRNFDTGRIEEIVRYSDERYLDHATGRLIAIGMCDTRIVMVPYETEKGLIRPVTVHATARKQISARLKSGRFSHE